MSRKLKIAFEVHDMDCEKGATLVPKSQVVLEMSEDDLRSIARIEEMTHAAWLLCFASIRQRLGIPEKIRAEMAAAMSTK